MELVFLNSFLNWVLVLAVALIVIPLVCITTDEKIDKVIKWVDNNIGVILCLTLFSGFLLMAGVFFVHAQGYSYDYCLPHGDALVVCFNRWGW